MILILSDSPREALLLGNLCDHRRWPYAAGRTLADFRRLADLSPPRVVVTRQALAEGYSDDIIKLVGEGGAGAAKPWVVVLMPANCSIQQEARQIALGADCVLRDPLRLEVLMEYLAKYQARPIAKKSAAPAKAVEFVFAGATVRPHECRLLLAKRSARIAPRVIELLQLLHRMEGRVTPYALLYSELFGRRFTGDTNNSRVLLNKAAAGFRAVGINFRAHVRVIAKSGYLYSASKRSLPR